MFTLLDWLASRFGEGPRRERERASNGTLETCKFKTSELFEFSDDRWAPVTSTSSNRLVRVVRLVTVGRLLVVVRLLAVVRRTAVVHLELDDVVVDLRQEISSLAQNLLQKSAQGRVLDLLQVVGDEEVVHVHLQLTVPQFRVVLFVFELARKRAYRIRRR